MKRILIIRLSSLGDIVLTQPITAALKHKYPQADLTYITKEQFVPLVEAFDTCGRIVTYQGSRTFLPDTRYDLIIDLHGKLNTWLLKRKIRAGRIVVYHKRHLLRRLIVWHLTTKTIPSTLSLYATVLSQIGFSEEEVRSLPDPRLRSLATSNPLASLDRKGRKLIALFPGAAHATKMYPIAQWEEVIRISGENYLFILSGNPAEDHLCRILHNKCPKKTLITGCHYGLADLIRIIGDCDLVLSNDSGPMHIAAALGKAQIALFGATHPRLGFSPMNSKAVILCRDLDCQPCSLHGGRRCPQWHFRCMKDIPAAKIVTLMDQLLETVTHTQTVE